MTDITKYRNVSLSHHAYDLCEKVSKFIVPGVTLSISKTVESLAAKETQKINGKAKRIKDK